MSAQPKIPDQSATDVVDVFDTWVAAGGLDLNLIKKESPNDLETSDVSYGFWISYGFSVQSSIYWIKEGAGVRQYLWLELALCQVPLATRAELLEFSMRWNRLTPSPLKLAIAEEGLLVLTLRTAVDGLALEYFKELLDCVPSVAEKVFEDLAKKFQVVPFMETMHPTSVAGSFRVH